MSMKLNEKQQEAATTLNGCLLIVAVAGSGKTTVLINRAVNLVNAGVDPKRILMITFTRYAARNMATKAKEIGDNKCIGLYTSTFHSFYLDMLRRYGNIIGMDPNFVILNSDGSIEDSISQVMAKYTEYGEVKGFPSFSDIREAYSYAINTGRPLDQVLSEFKETMDYVAELCDLYEIWTKEKEATNNYTYDDLMVKMLELMQTENGRNAVSSLFDYIMVDEYQDINKPQNEILQLLTSSNPNVAVVGDDYQAIYGFRGSNVGYIVNYEKMNPGTRVVTVDTNYRSSDEILEFVNTVMDRNCDFGIKKDMKGTGKSFGPVILNHVDDEEDEYQHIVDSIIRVHSEGTPYSECAVLNSKSKPLHKLELLLVRNNLPYEMRGGKKFLDRDEVRDLIALITCILAPTSKKSMLSWYRVLTQLVTDVGQKKATGLVECCAEPDFPLSATINGKKPSASIRKQLENLHVYLSKVQNATYESGYQKSLRMLVDGYYDFRHDLIENSKKYKQESNRTDAFNELESKREILETFREIGEQYIDFQTFLDGLTMNDTSKSSDDCICLSTVHSAKGLEWDNVYMMDVISALYPGKNYSKEEQNENPRVFYVGITRAKKHLILYHPQLILSRGEYVPIDVSPYVSEVTKHYCLTYIKEQTLTNQDIVHHYPLRFEFIPSSVFGKTVRQRLTPERLEQISKNVCKIGVCSCCGGAVGSDHLFAHEVWEYNDYKKIQALADIIPVCERCSAVISFDHSVNKRNIDRNDLFQWYASVNRIPVSAAEEELTRARQKQNEREQFIWQQDDGSVDKVIRRYLDAENKVAKYQIHMLTVPYSRNEEFKEDCYRYGVRPKWLVEYKVWSYQGKTIPELDQKWGVIN